MEMSVCNKYTPENGNNFRLKGLYNFKLNWL